MVGVCHFDGSCLSDRIRLWSFHWKGFVAVILSDSEIMRRMELMSEQRIVINPEPDMRAIQPASVDLRLSPQIIYKGIPGRVKDDKYVMTPGQFVFGSTIERIEVPPDLAARVEGKSSLGRVGLMVHVTAGFIDPGFRGNITLELKNLSDEPITLEVGMPISQVCFLEVFGKVLRPYGSEELGSKYQDSEGTIPSHLDLGTS